MDLVVIAVTVILTLVTFVSGLVIGGAMVGINKDKGNK